MPDLCYRAIFPSNLYFAGAVERQKLVYIMNRDASANLTISSPLEAHKSHCICYSVVGVDVGFENPTFACLEVDYEVSDGLWMYKDITFLSVAG